MEDFESYRPLLFSIAYRMLGSASEAEDIVQDAYLRYHAADTEIHSLKSYLSTIITRLCIDQLKSARVEREQYFGLWMPEPIITDHNKITPLDNTEQAESLSLAFLTLLECLSPQERAVFLLVEVFDYSYQDVAEIVGQSATNCRQIFHRAKARIDEKRPRFEPSRDAREQLTASFMMACQQGDLDGLASLLAQDVTIWTDSGGKARAAVRPVYGREHVIRFFLGILKKAPADGLVTVAEVNGQLSILYWIGEKLSYVIAIDMVDDQIYGFRFIANPDKLKYIQTQLKN